MNMCNEEYLTVQELCKILKTSESTIYRLIESDMIPHIKFGRRYKIPASWLNKQNPRYIQT